MSIQSAALMSVSGGWDSFDRVSSLLDNLIEQVKASTETGLEFDHDDTASSLFGINVGIVDPKEDIIKRLTEARDNIDNLCTFVQYVTAWLPD